MARWRGPIGSQAAELGVRETVRLSEVAPEYVDRAKEMLGELLGREADLTLQNRDRIRGQRRAAGLLAWFRGMLAENPPRFMGATHQRVLREVLNDEEMQRTRLYQKLLGTGTSLSGAERETAFSALGALTDPTAVTGRGAGKRVSALARSAGGGKTTVVAGMQDFLPGDLQQLPGTLREKLTALSQYALADAPSPFAKGVATVLENLGVDRRGAIRAAVLWEEDARRAFWLGPSVMDIGGPMGVGRRSRVALGLAPAARALGEQDLRFWFGTTAHASTYQAHRRREAQMYREAVNEAVERRLRAIRAGEAPLPWRATDEPLAVFGGKGIPQALVGSGLRRAMRRLPEEQAAEKILALARRHIELRPDTKYGEAARRFLEEYEARKNRIIRQRVRAAVRPSVGRKGLPAPTIPETVQTLEPVPAAVQTYLQDELRETMLAFQRRLNFTSWMQDNLPSIMAREPDRVPGVMKRLMRLSTGVMTALDDPERVVARLDALLTTAASDPRISRWRLRAATTVETTALMAADAFRALDIVPDTMAGISRLTPTDWRALRDAAWGTSILFRPDGQIRAEVARLLPPHLQPTPAGLPSAVRVMGFAAQAMNVGSQRAQRELAENMSRAFRSENPLERELAKVLHSVYVEAVRHGTPITEETLATIGINTLRTVVRGSQERGIPPIMPELIQHPSVARVLSEPYPSLARRRMLRTFYRLWYGTRRTGHRQIPPVVDIVNAEKRLRRSGLEMSTEMPDVPELTPDGFLSGTRQIGEYARSLESAAQAALEQRVVKGYPKVLEALESIRQQRVPEPAVGLEKLLEVIAHETGAPPERVRDTLERMFPNSSPDTIVRRLQERWKQPQWARLFEPMAGQAASREVTRDVGEGGYAW